MTHALDQRGAAMLLVKAAHAFRVLTGVEAIRMLSDDLHEDVARSEQSELDRLRRMKGQHERRDGS